MPRHVWTKEQCREMGKRSWERKRQRKAEALLNPPPPNGHTAPKPEPVDPDSVTTTDGKSNAFSVKRLARVRKQLTRIDGMLDTETDPAKIDRLAAASSKLEEQERRLSSRPLPPVLRVAEQKNTRHRGLFSPPPPPPKAG
jgi:hypothetical protein